MVALPFRDNQFDAIFSIATLHHIPRAQKRRHVIQDMLRIGLPSALICWEILVDKK